MPEQSDYIEGFYCCCLSMVKLVCVAAGVTLVDVECFLFLTEVHLDSQTFIR